MKSRPIEAKKTDPEHRISKHHTIELCHHNSIKSRKRYQEGKNSNDSNCHIIVIAHREQNKGWFGGGCSRVSRNTGGNEQM